MTHSETGLQELLEELATIRRADFRGYKPGSLQRRVRKRMAQLNLKDYPEYTSYLRAHAEEINFLLQVVLINVTEFFRDPHAWEALAREALPPILNAMMPGDTFRAWCAGCASGEEVYSLAILLAEHFGPRLSNYDIKIYASDHDEEALSVARRAEYSIDKLRRLRPEWRERYFVTGETGTTARVVRTLRKLAIFGRANLVNDAPISHIQLLVCRNVLIYFDTDLQRNVLHKFRYALENGGILFLGRSESQLRDYSNFRVVNAKWRIFRCVKEIPVRGGQTISTDEHALNEQRLAQRYVLDALKSGVVVLDNAGTIVSANDAAQRMWGIHDKPLVGTSIYQSPFVELWPQLHNTLQQAGAQAGKEPLRMIAKFPVDNSEHAIEITLRAIEDSDGHRSGMLFVSEDVSNQERLRTTVEELETTAEELHAANEELETSNEELQSTNEELETTNEELQSTTEELETTNEELHSLNEELQTINDELEQRNRDLEEATARYGETVSAMPLPIMVVNDNGGVLLFNPAAEKLFDLEAKVVVGLSLKQLPIDTRLRDTLLRAHESVLRTLQGTTVKKASVKLGEYKGPAEVRITPLPTSAGRGMLMVFDTEAAATQESKAARITKKGKGKATKVGAIGASPKRRK